MNRWSSYLLTIAFALVVAGGATKYTLTQHDKVAGTMVLPTATVQPSPTATPIVIPSPTPNPTPVPMPAATTTPIPQRTAVTNSFVHMRSAKSTASPIVVDLLGGTRVVLDSDETSLWQAVSYGSYHGYVWKSYLSY